MNQIGVTTEIADFRNDSVILTESLTVSRQKGLIAAEFIPKNAVVFSYQNQVSFERTRTSIQVGSDVHIEAGEFASFTNHSCEPNAYLWTNLRNEGYEAHVVLVTVKDIEKGEEICFDYATTETKVTKDLQHVVCKCGSKSCRKSIDGFFSLPIQKRRELIDSGMLAPHLQKEIVLE